MSREEFVARLKQIEANVIAIEERRQQNLENFVQASRDFSKGSLEIIERIQSLNAGAQA